MKIGVIGANGFIGSKLCLKYLSEKHDVLAFFNQNKSSIPKDCILCPPGNLPKSYIDCLIVCIGSHSLSYRQYLDQYLYLNTIINELNFNKIIFISSVEVYGKSNDIIKIDSPHNQPNTYGMSKLAQEFLIRSCERYSIIRPTYIYGPGMNGNSIIPIWINSALSKKEIIVFGQGNRKQDYLHIDDFTELCSLVTANNQNNTIIAATGKSISNLYLAKEISGNINGTVIKYQGQDTAGSFKYDISGTHEIYGWVPKISIENGLKSYLNNENFNI